MNNREIYRILELLGMVEDKCHSEDNYCYESAADEFQISTSKDIVSLTNFVDDLCVNNDINYIKKFLVCMLFENGKE